MTPEEQRLVIQQAVGAAMAIGGTPEVANVVSAAPASPAPVSAPSAASISKLTLQNGSVGDLSCRAQTSQNTGFYFPNGQSISLLAAGEEVMTISPSGVTVRGDLNTGQSGTSSVASSGQSNVVGAFVSNGPTWANNIPVEFCRFPLSTQTTTPFFIYLSEDHAGQSKTDKIYYFSLEGQSSTTLYLVSPSMVREAGPKTYWDLLARATDNQVVFFIRRRNATTHTSENQSSTISVMVVSPSVGSVRVRGVNTFSETPTALGLDASSTSEKIVLNNGTVQHELSVASGSGANQFIQFPPAAPTSTASYLLTSSFNSGTKVHTLSWSTGVSATTVTASGNISTTGGSISTTNGTLSGAGVQTNGLTLGNPSPGTQFPTGTPTNLSSPAGYLSLTVNGVNTFIPYYT